MWLYYIAPALDVWEAYSCTACIDVQYSILLSQCSNAPPTFLSGSTPLNNGICDESLRIFSLYCISLEEFWATGRHPYKMFCGIAIVSSPPICPPDSSKSLNRLRNWTQSASTIKFRGGGEHGMASVELEFIAVTAVIFYTIEKKCNRTCDTHLISVCFVETPCRI